MVEQKGGSTEEEATSDQQHEAVQKYYGRVLSSTSDLKTSACTNKTKPTRQILELLQLVPKEVKAKYYGCGSVLPGGIEGLTVLDLGSGSGQDCYVAAALVGPKGKVIGVDMTDEQLLTARQSIKAFAANLGWEPNLSFQKGLIEFLSQTGLEAETIDLCISNCVLNLSPRKDLVLKGVYDLLKPGGEFFFSDCFASRRLSEELKSHEVMLGECLGGALYVQDFYRLCHQVGFTDPRRVSCTPIDIIDEELSQLVGPAVTFYSMTFRLFKLDTLETTCEDYGQVAVYKGTIRGHEQLYVLDEKHSFEAHKPLLVCGNTASMLSETYLKDHFTVSGDRSKHFGLFPCDDSKSSMPLPATSSGACC